MYKIHLVQSNFLKIPCSLSELISFFDWCVAIKILWTTKKYVVLYECNFCIRIYSSCKEQGKQKWNTIYNITSLLLLFVRQWANSPT